MNKFSYFSDKLIAFLFGLLLGGYFLPTTLTKLLFAFTFSLCLTESIRLLSNEKHPPIDKRFSPTKERILLSGETEPLILLLPFLQRRYSSVVQKENMLVLNRGLILASKFTVEPLSPDTLISLNYTAKKEGAEKLSVICNSFSPKAQEYALKLGVKLIDYDKLFTILKKADCLPLIEEKSREPKFRKLLKLFSRKRAVPLLSCSLLLFFFSRFTAFSIFYIASAIACALLAIFSLFVKAKN